MRSEKKHKEIYEGNDQDKRSHPFKKMEGDMELDRGTIHHGDRH